MRNLALVCVLFWTLFLSGCVTLSLYPLYTEKDLVADLPLEGKWTDPSSKETWDIRRGGDGYVVMGQDGEAVKLRLVRLGERRFMDLTANDTPSLAIAGHMFGKVWIAGDELHLQMMDSDWLEKKARAGGVAFVELPDKDVLLTAPTAALQDLVLHAGDDAFNEPGVLRRVAVK
jgi:hypothetical protein